MRIINHNKKLRKKRRISANIKGTSEKPRISVYRSNKYIYAQAIDDVNRKTLAAFSSLKLEKEKKSLQAKKVGLELGKILLEKKIKQAVFDRGIYSYKGRVAKLAEGLRESGLKI